VHQCKTETETIMLKGSASHNYTSRQAIRN
jgi:hypothetical protein